MISDQEEEIWYATIGDLCGALVAEPDLEALVGIAERAVAMYDPKSEAVLLENSRDFARVHLVRRAGVETLAIQAYAVPRGSQSTS